MDTAAAPWARWRRAVAFLLLVGVAALLLPLSAYTVEAVSDRAENWILVLQLSLMALVGAATGGGMRGLGPAGASTRRRALVWGSAALLATVVANAVWLVLLAG